MKKEIVKPLYKIFVGESIKSRLKFQRKHGYEDILENEDEYYSSDMNTEERPLIGKDKEGNDFIEFDPCSLSDEDLEKIFELKKKFNLRMKMEGLGMHNDTFSVTFTLKK